MAKALIGQADSAEATIPIKGGVPAGRHLHNFMEQVTASCFHHDSITRWNAILRRSVELSSTQLARIGVKASRSVLCCLMSAIRGLTTTTSAQSPYNGTYSTLHRSATRSCSRSCNPKILSPSLVLRQSAVAIFGSHIRRQCITSQVAMTSGNFLVSTRPGTAAVSSEESKTHADPAGFSAISWNPVFQPAVHRTTI